MPALVTVILLLALFGLLLLCVTAVTTVLQATNNYSVDIMLALFLIIGGVIGAQFGVRGAAHFRGEQLRLMMALLVLGVAFRLLLGLVITPFDLYSVTVGAP